MSGQPERPDADLREPEAGAEHAADNEESLSAAGDGGTETMQAELEDARASAQENWDKYLRAMAELENVRKRSSRDIENTRKFSIEPFARDLLAVRDSLEMGLNAATGTDAAALREGSEATLKLLAGTMEQFGVTELDPLGEPFDPQLHEAMMLQPSADAEPGTVITVYQKGYALHGRLLRPARVVVAEAAPATPDNNSDAD